VPAEVELVPFVVVVEFMGETEVVLAESRLVMGLGVRMALIASLTSDWRMVELVAAVLVRDGQSEGLIVVRLVELPQSG
jgi:hypothetical protein